MPESSATDRKIKNSPWQVYDHSTRKGDGKGDQDVHIFRCDTRVRVEAVDQDSAIEAAKAGVPLIELDGFVVEDGELWVDEGVDIEPDVTEGATPRP